MVIIFLLEFNLLPKLRTQTSARKICFLISHSYAGGAEKIWLDLADGLAMRGHLVTLVALYPAGKQDTSVEKRWTHLAAIRPTGPLAIVRSVQKLAQLFRRERFDFAFTALPAANAIAPLAVRLAGTPTKVVRSHHSPVSTHSRILNTIDGITGAWGSVRATVSVSKTVDTSLAEKSAAYRMRAVVIPNALSADIEEELARLSARHDRSAAKARVVVATGRLAEQKNYPVLIRASRLMPGVKVIIVGSGPDEAMLREQVHALGVEADVHFVGTRPRKETLALLADGDVFVQPSLFEGHSLALIEAGKLGIPLIVSNVPVQLEAITDGNGVLCGIAVDPHDEMALAAAISAQLDDPAIYRDFSAKSRRLVQNATFSNMVDAYERLMDF